MDGLYLAVKVIPSGAGTPVVEQVKITANTAARKIIDIVRRW
jgi:hypothetical protein